MALSKSTITGRVPLPTDENLQFAELTFALSGLDTEGVSVLPGGVSTRAVLVGSDIPAGFELWQNTAGLHGTHYRVLARWTVKDRDGVRDQYADLGIIQVGSDPSYTLADLINNGVPPAIGTFWSAITQAQYDAVIQAAADAQASATAAALYDGLWLDTVAALIADTSLTYAPALPGTVVAGDYVQTRKEGFAYQVAASGATDHHVTTAGGVKLKVSPINGEEYHTAAFGSGWEAVRSAALASDGATLVVSKGEVIYRNVIFTGAKRVVGHGATLKLADGVSTTTTAPISGTGSVVIPVADVAGFAVGDGVLIFYGTKSYSPYSPHNLRAHTITDISGTNITVDASEEFILGGDIIPSGASVQRGSVGLVTTRAGCEVEGLTFNGNVAQQPDAHWLLQVMLVHIGSRTKTVGCKFYDTPTDAILFSQVDYGPAETDGLVLQCEFVNIGANAGHLSYHNNVTFLKNTVNGANKKNVSGAETIHQDGAFIYSNGCNGMIVDDCTISDAISAIGSIDSSNNSRVKLINSRIYNCLYPIEADSLTNAPSEGYLWVINNEFDGVGVTDSVINISSIETTSATFPKNFWFNDNIFRNVRIAGQRISNLLLTGNVFTHTDSTKTLLEVADPVGLTARSNRFTGGNNQLRLRFTGGTDAYVGDFTIDDNTFFDAKFYAIRADASTDSSGSFSRATAANNRLLKGPNSNVGWRGVAASSGLTVRNNHFQADQTAVWLRLGGADQPGGLIMYDNLLNGSLDTPKGVFTISSGALLIVPATGIHNDVVITITPKNAAATSLQASSSALYVSAVNSRTSFFVSTADGLPVGASCEFYYLVDGKR